MSLAVRRAEFNAVAAWLRAAKEPPTPSPRLREVNRRFRRLRTALRQQRSRPAHPQL
jgi:hypothetical protein